ncbi:MAG: 1-acyl-sn-glycerol-3-phosphate acyltransferase [Schleiferiaceae bacterium]|nr:1-acyl-sn-glycerol-3-phosphate acyltransferase [Schleiferiaceae bacterium]
MKHLLAFVRLIGLAFLFTLTSLLVVLGRLFGRKGAHAMLRFGVYCKAKLLGIKSDVFGETTKQTQLILINHPSYLDIMFLNFVKHPTTLLAAINFKNWPLVGWLGKALNVIWVKRHDRNAGKQVLLDASQRFKKGLCLMTSPEGRTSGTHDIYPVKPGLFMLAQSANVPITFMCLKYKNNAVPYFHSLKEGFVPHFLKHFWNVLGQWRIPVEVHFSEPNFFANAREGVQAFYEFNKKHLQDVLHFEVPVKEEFIGEALTRLDGTLLSFRAESKEELLA